MSCLPFTKSPVPHASSLYPFVEKMYKLYGDAITFYGIVQDSDKDAKEFANKYGLTFPQLIDYPTYQVSQKYGVEVVPTLYLLNSEKSIEFVSSSFVKAELDTLNRKLSAVAGKEEVDIFAGTHVPAFKPG